MLNKVKAHHRSKNEGIQEYNRLLRLSTTDIAGTADSLTGFIGLSFFYWSTILTGINEKVIC